MGIVEYEYADGRLFVRALKEAGYSLREELIRLRAAPRVHKAASIPWHGGPQKWDKSLLNPATGVMQTIHSSYEDLAPGGKSQRHAHQNPALLFVLEGQGYDISDGERQDWEEGDVALVAAGTVHQHFNANPDRPARVLIIKSKPLYMFANLIFQGFLEKAPKVAQPGWEDYRPSD